MCVSSKFWQRAFFRCGVFAIRVDLAYEFCCTLRGVHNRLCLYPGKYVVITTMDSLTQVLYMPVFNPWLLSAVSLDGAVGSQFVMVPFLVGVVRVGRRVG